MRRSYSSRVGRSDDAESRSSSHVRQGAETESLGPSDASVQRLSDDETASSEPVRSPRSMGTLGSSPELVQRAEAVSESADATSTPKAIGSLGSSADLLQRVTDQSGSSVGSKTNGPDSDERWAAGRGGPTSLQRSTATAQDTGPAGETQVPDSVRDVISSSGRSLDTSIQRAVEDRMGDSLGDVRIHTGPKAAQACEQINARAFTVGNHVAFNSGEYDPSSPEGQHVLAHELAHVRQQTGGAVSMLPQENLGLEIDPDPQLEREAEETAQRVMEGGELGIQRLGQTEIHVQRQDKYSRREVFTGKPGADETANALDDVADPQTLLERIVSGAQEIDWVSVFKKAGLAAAKTNAVTSATLSAADELDSQVRSNSVSEGDLIAQLEQREPPQSWVKTIAQQAADLVGSDTGLGSSQGDELGR